MNGITHGVAGSAVLPRSQQFDGQPVDVAAHRNGAAVHRVQHPRAGARVDDERSQSRSVRNAERKALNALGLEADASPQEVKTRFKSLVKRHHPDANGGDRSSEDKLREIIQAYNYLKSVGFR